jgi:cell division ATPase FtsA
MMRSAGRADCAAGREAADGVATQIMDSLRYVTHRFGSVSVGRVLLTGCGAAMPGLCEWVEAQTGLDVRVLAWDDLCVDAPSGAEDAASVLVGAAAAATSESLIARAAA